MPRKFAEPDRSSLFPACRVCLFVCVYFHASQVCRACWLMLLVTLPGLLPRASLLSRFASTQSLLDRASCYLAESAHLCEFTFMFPKFSEPARSCFLRPCPICTPVRVYISCFASLPTLLASASCDPAGSAHRTNFLSCFASSPSLLARASFDLAGSARCPSLLSCYESSQSLLARASCDLVGSARPCEFTLRLRKFAEPPGSCFLRSSRVCSPVRVDFHASQVRGAYSLVLLATLPGLLTRESLLSCFVSSPSLLTCWLVLFASSPRLLARASCELAGSAHPCLFTLMLRKFAETARSCFLQTSRVCLPGLVYFHASLVRRACSLMLLATLQGLFTRASLLSCFASSPSLLGRASCDIAESAHLYEFTFMLRKFTEIARSCFLIASRVCLPVLVYFLASQVRRACSLVLLATLPGLLTCTNLLSCFAISPSLLVRSSFDLAGSTRPCEFTFMLHKFAEPAGPRFWQPCRVFSPVRVYFHASQVRRACWLVLLATLPGLLTRARLLSCFASSSSLLARASCYLAGSAHPYEFTFRHRKFAEPARSCFLRHCRVC
ncbi:hypothetical protein CDL15_Pgr029163 [Punica granatum]|uniref:Uncharacterized protein n=1 Tax=Punica granatum TaxID=22663 RepID=A0A218X6U3_PUNGR|nr:hypothetical protein CDL15_Pgr029163 [Punica granatum]